MFDFFKSLFRPDPPSGTTAKERLRLVLLSDHLALAPDVVDALKRDLLDVISRYVEIDQEHADVTFEHREREVAMLASIPITGMRNGRGSASAADARAPESPAAEPSSWQTGRVESVEETPMNDAPQSSDVEETNDADDALADSPDAVEEPSESGAFEPVTTGTGVPDTGDTPANLPDLVQPLPKPKPPVSGGAAAAPDHDVRDRVDDDSATVEAIDRLAGADIAPPGDDLALGVPMPARSANASRPRKRRRRKRS